MRAAGAYEQEQDSGKKAVGGGGGGRVQSTADREGEFKMAQEGAKLMKDQWAKENKGKPVDERFWATVEDTTQGLMQANRNLNPRQAAMFAEQLATPGKAGSAQFKAEYGDNPGDPVTITTDKGGMKIKMDPAQFELLNNARAAQYKKEAEAEAKAKADEEHRKETTKKVIGAVGDIARGDRKGSFGCRF